MTNPDTLIDLAPSTAAPLSAFYDTAVYRLGRGEVAQWTKGGGGRAAHCDECARLQHETRGASGPRMAPRERRTVIRECPEGAVSLLLCTRHATAWRDRDDTDAPTAPTTKKGRR
ncbi:hypothetical protein [Nocardia cyriacigeorgica]|uniref:hypothetical protein n=1 Tax=Nocardia cyriacigeorgica TaxID=135487 RepID=UPI0024579301|nr:hypothetical protein [Nocardia cyriacigeorgica]